MDSSLLKLDEVSKSFGDKLIFNNISLTLEKSKSVCIKAPSGKGKSTLLSLAGLLLQPSDGKIFFDGVDTTNLYDEDLSKIRRDRIGFLFQHTQLAGTLRACDNVSLAANFASKNEIDFSKGEIENRRKALLERFDLGSYYYYFPHQLSIGQKRRIACARALFMEPELIIADEPTNDLDEANRQIMIQALFERVQSGNSALLYATHDEDLAMMADEIIEL